MKVTRVFISLVMASLGMTFLTPSGFSEDQPVLNGSSNQSVLTGESNLSGTNPVYYSNNNYESRMNSGPFCLEGWISGGAVSNTTSPITTGADPEELQMNQFYLTLGLNADRGCCRPGIGGRVDLLYGTDYLYTSSLGLESSNTRAWPYEGPAETVYEATPKWNRKENGEYKQYGLAMPQAYVEFYAPIMAGLNVKVGHYYSPVGYESVMAPHNFFYTHSYSMLYGEAQTLTGVLATQKVNQKFSILGGIDQGWNTWDGYDDDISYLAGASLKNSSGTGSLAFTLSTGKQVINWYNPITASDTIKGNQTNYSLVYQRQLGCNLQYVLQNDLGILEDGKVRINGNKAEYDKAHWYSLVNYLFYKITPCCTLGARFEWFKDEGLSRYASIPTERTNSQLDYVTRGDNYYNVSLGLNWQLRENLMIRPEVRYDWSDFELEYSDGTVINAYDSGSKKDLVTVGGDVIFRF